MGGVEAIVNIITAFCSIAIFLAHIVD